MTDFLRRERRFVDFESQNGRVPKWPSERQKSIQKMLYFSSSLFQMGGTVRVVSGIHVGQTDPIIVDIYGSFIIPAAEPRCALD
jgi:hypothetical protein